jgi:hypothetical protein
MDSVPCQVSVLVSQALTSVDIANLADSLTLCAMQVWQLVLNKNSQPSVSQHRLPQPDSWSPVGDPWLSIMLTFVTYSISSIIGRS